MFWLFISKVVFGSLQAHLKQWDVGLYELSQLCDLVNSKAQKIVT